MTSKGRDAQASAGVGWAMNQQPMEEKNCFRPIPFVSPDNTDQLTYEPAENLKEALKALDEANTICRLTPSFDNIADACRKCRTAFAEFIGAALTVGGSVRKTILPHVESLLRDCEESVGGALDSISDPEQKRLAEGYHSHIGDRIRLAAALRANALPGYMDEIQAACEQSGVLIDKETYDNLSDAMKPRFGPAEPVQPKQHENRLIEVYRWSGNSGASA